MAGGHGCLLPQENAQNGESFQYPQNSPQKSRLILARKLVFPNPQHSPARLSQCAIHNSVALLVQRKFAPPECSIVLWLCRVLGAAVPEAAVHEHREPRLLESEIWFAEYRLIAPPARDAVPPHQFRQRQFRVLVPASANPGHDIGAFRLGEDVWHGQPSE